MFYRFVYIVWKVFWSSFVTLLISIGLFGLALFLLLQTQITRDYLTKTTVEWYNHNHIGTLEIGKIEGLLPFRVILSDVTLSHEDKHTARLESLNLSIDILALFRNNLSLHDITLTNPEFRLRKDQDGQYDLVRALTRIREEEDTEDLQEIPDVSEVSEFIQRFEVYAPLVRIRNGSLSLHDEDLNQWLAQDSLLQIENINTEFFLEISPTQRYIDVFYLTARLPDYQSREMILSGQIYNDSRYLEMNAMKMQFGQSHIEWSMDFSGIDLLSASLTAQLHNTPFSLQIQQLLIQPSDVSLFTDKYPHELDDLHLEMTARGLADEVKLSHFELNSGDTRLLLEGTINNLFQAANLSYDLDIRHLYPGQLPHKLTKRADIAISSDKWPNFEYDGHVSGTRDSLLFSIDTHLPHGSLFSSGSIDWSAAANVEVTLAVDQLKLADLFPAISYPGILNAWIKLDGSDLLSDNRTITMEAAFWDSYIAEWMIPELKIETRYHHDLMDHSFAYRHDDQHLEGTGTVRFTGTSPHFVFRGGARNLNLDKVSGPLNLPETVWNMNFDLNWHGRTIEEWYGRAIVDVLPSTVNGETLGSHQFYLDLNHPESEQRSLRFTSTMLDLIMEGEIHIPSLLPLYNHWNNYFADRWNHEFLFDREDHQRSSLDDAVVPLNAELVLEMKNTGLIKAYFPEIKLLETDARIAVDMDADPERLSLHARWNDRHLSFNGVSLENARIRLTSDLRYGQLFRDKALVDLEILADFFQYDEVRMDDVRLSNSFRDNHLHGRVEIGKMGTDVTFSTKYSGSMDSLHIQGEIEELVFGSERYMWTMETNPQIRYDHEKRLHLNHFTLLSGSDRVDVNGVFSAQEHDSVKYRFENVNLQRISQIINGRVDFQGSLNASFVTKNLVADPYFSGTIDVDRLAFDGRPVGDVSFSSDYDPGQEHFNTEISVFTDPEKYADYLALNSGVGQNILARGWFRSPANQSNAETLYYFDVDMDEIDAWILMYLMSNIFEDVEGRGEGRGHVTGNLSHIDFKSDFTVTEAVVEPVFFETVYTLEGTLSVNRNGVQVHQIRARDRINGTGLLTGSYDFNEFRDERFMDLTLQLNNLLFLNNSYDPDVPFYGRVSGTGEVNISGSNLSPFVRTVGPVTTTPHSRLAIPLMDQFIDEGLGRFIRFVHDFDEVKTATRTRDAELAGQQEERTFMEVFRLDLQFVASPNSNVQLIFDPVTGEIVNAMGSGRVRITLEDETLQIFGSYDISDGDYLFVGGDIMTRRFTLREGGTIRWEGDPVNALLNIVAVYRTRPNIAPLLGVAAEMTNRIPVNLLLEITGPLDNIENDFYFEFPNAIDATQNAAVLNVLNSEEQKLIQATSLLFTGGFISGTLVGDTQAQELGSTLQARAGQVGISQLLSAQINALLSENLINLDVDLNLFGFDQADLGIALRLFDDRLVLRREGEVGGEQTNIGDLGATYRINPNLSVEVFHRKDPMLMSILGAQAEVENVNGVGLEAQFRFNSWRELGQRIWYNMSTGFGLFGREQRAEAEREQASESGIDTSMPDTDTTF